MKPIVEQLQNLIHHSNERISQNLVFTFNALQSNFYVLQELLLLQKKFRDVQKSVSLQLSNESIANRSNQIDSVHENDTEITGLSLEMSEECINVQSLGTNESGTSNDTANISDIDRNISDVTIEQTESNIFEEDKKQFVENVCVSTQTLNTLEECKSHRKGIVEIKTVKLLKNSRTKLKCSNNKKPLITIKEKSNFQGSDSCISENESSFLENESDVIKRRDYYNSNLGNKRKIELTSNELQRNTKLKNPEKDDNNFIKGNKKIRYNNLALNKGHIILKSNRVPSTNIDNICVLLETALKMFNLTTIPNTRTITDGDNNQICERSILNTETTGISRKCNICKRSSSERQNGFKKCKLKSTSKSI